MIQIEKLIMEAMKSHDKVASETYKLIKAKILEFKTAKNAREYNDEAEVSLLQKMVKERKESAEIYQQNGRAELAEAELAQVKVIETLLPKVASKEEVEAWLNTKYPDGIEKAAMGMAIKEVKAQFVGVDGGMVAGLVKSKLKG